MLGLFTALRWSIQTAAWATPKIQLWSRERNLNRVEGERHLRARNYAEAEKHLVLAVEQADQQQHSVRRIQFRLYLAEAQRRQSKLEEAEASVRLALEHTARISSPSGYVQCLDALAEVFHDGHNYAAMEQVLQEAVRIEEAMPHPDSVRMARRVYRLGIARHKSGCLEEAIPALERAVILYEEVCGEEHLETANLLSDLGEIYRANNQQEDAQRCLRRAMRIHENSCGPDSRETVRDLHNFAGSLEESGDIEAAAAQYERALLLKERTIGGDLEELAEMQYGVAGMYVSWNNYPRARELLYEAIGTFKRKKGPRLAVAHEVLALVEECSGRYLQAVAELALAAKVWRVCGPERTPELIDTLERRATLLDQLRRKKEAEWIRGKAAELGAAAGQPT